MKNRLIELDILRTIAILLVLGPHIPTMPPADYPEIVRTLFGFWVKGGWIGVDLFFVLSGFLVSGLLFREYTKYGHIKLDRFLIRRGFKIYPAYYIFLLCTYLVVTFLGHPDPVEPYTFLSNALFIQNYGPAIWNHTWTLAVEEHFYILLPILIWYLYRTQKGSSDTFRGIIKIFFFMAVATLLLRIGTTLALDYTHKTHLYPTHLRIESLMFGAFISYFYHFRRERTLSVLRRYRLLTIPLSFIFAGTSLVFFVHDTFMHTIGFSLLYVGFGLQLLHLILWQAPLKEWLLKRLFWFSRIGFYSYSIYLWHIPFKMWVVFYLVPRKTGYELSFYTEWILFVIGSVVVGILMARLIEIPALKLRDKLYPTRSGTLSNLANSEPKS